MSFNDRPRMRPWQLDEEPVYCEADPAEVICEGSDDDYYPDPALRRERIEMAAARFLSGRHTYLLSAGLRGPFDASSGWTNPWQSVKPNTSRTPTPTHNKSTELFAAPVMKSSAAKQRHVINSPIMQTTHLDSTHLPSPVSLDQATSASQHQFLKRETVNVVESWRHRINTKKPSVDSSSSAPQKSSQKRSRALNSSPIKSVSKRRRTLDLANGGNVSSDEDDGITGSPRYASQPTQPYVHDKDYTSPRKAAQIWWGEGAHHSPRLALTPRKLRLLSHGYDDGESSDELTSNAHDSPSKQRVRRTASRRAGSASVIDNHHTQARRTTSQSSSSEGTDASDNKDSVLQKLRSASPRPSVHPGPSQQACLPEIVPVSSSLTSIDSSVSPLPGYAHAESEIQDDCSSSAGDSTVVMGDLDVVMEEIVVQGDEGDASSSSASDAESGPESELSSEAESDEEMEDQVEPQLQEKDLSEAVQPSSAHSTQDVSIPIEVAESQELPASSVAQACSIVQDATSDKQTLVEKESQDSIGGDGIVLSSQPTIDADPSGLNEQTPKLESGESAILAIADQISIAGETEKPPSTAVVHAKTSSQTQVMSVAELLNDPPAPAQTQLYEVVEDSPDCLPVTHSNDFAQPPPLPTTSPTVYEQPTNENVTRPVFRELSGNAVTSTAKHANITCDTSDPSKADASLAPTSKNQPIQECAAPVALVTPRRPLPATAQSPAQDPNTAQFDRVSPWTRLSYAMRATAQEALAATGAIFGLPQELPLQNAPQTPKQADRVVPESSATASDSMGQASILSPDNTQRLDEPFEPAPSVRASSAPVDTATASSIENIIMTNNVPAAKQSDQSPRPRISLDCADSPRGILAVSVDQAEDRPAKRKKRVSWAALPHELSSGAELSDCVEKVVQPDLACDGRHDLEDVTSAVTVAAAPACITTQPACNTAVPLDVPAADEAAAGLSQTDIVDDVLSNLSDFLGFMDVETDIQQARAELGDDEQTMTKTFSIAA